MVSEVDLEDPNGPCFIPAFWDSQIVPKYDNSSGGSYTFQYEGNNDCGTPSRLWEPTFICDKHVEANMGSIQETSPDSCKYQTTIYTRYACG